MKTNYPLIEIEEFLETRLKIAPNKLRLKQLEEGHSSQVMSFVEDDQQRVIRIREDLNDLLADEYAYKRYSHYLPIPQIYLLDRYDQSSFFCISEYVEGKTVLSLDKEQFESFLPAILKCFAGIFYMDITDTTGYGHIDPLTGNAPFASYASFLQSEIELLGIENLLKQAESINLDHKDVFALVKQFDNNLQSASEIRRLNHGDPGNDNMIVKNEGISGIIDWEQMAYGDWMRDFSRLEYYGDNRYGSAEAFASQYDLESDNLHERRSLYWSIFALRDIEFASTQGNEEVSNRLRKNIEEKVLA